MKKIFILLGILFFPFSLHAELDGFSSMRPAFWRSSRTVTADTFVLIATGSIHFHGVVVSNPGAATSFVSFFNSTTTNTSLMSFSTAAIVDTSSYKTPLYDMYFSSGVVYNKQGVADINILWDYVLPNMSNKQIVPFTP